MNQILTDAPYARSIETKGVHLPSKREIVPTEAGALTKDKILSAAQRLFAEKGFEGVSMRDVGKAAGVPFALTTYHFETKLNLYKSVFRRHRNLLYDDRMEALKNLTLTGDSDRDILQITKAIIEPLMKLRGVRGGRDILRLVGRELYCPVEIKEGLVEEYFDPIAQLVIELLQKVVPTASRSQVSWAFYFSTGAIAINHVDSGRVERISGGSCRNADTAAVVEELTIFVAGAIGGALAPRARKRKHP